MKKLIFTLMMMAGLAMIAGTAMGQGKFSPYPSGSYTYNVPYTLVNDGQVTLTLTGGEMTVGTTTPASLTSGSTVSLTAGSGNIVIPITFDATASGDKSIKVEVQDLTSTCSNNIHLDITIATPPSIDLTLSRSGDAEICQTVIEATTSNTPGSDSQTNSITFTVSANISDAPAGTTWDYTISIPNPTPNLLDYSVTKGGSEVTFPLSVSDIPVGTTSEEYIVTFTTTTGISAATILGEITNASITENTDNLTFDETGTGSNTAQTIAKSVPTLGQFN